MSDEASARNEVNGAVAGPVVQAGSIGHVIMHSPPIAAAQPMPTAMFSMRGDLPDFVGRQDELRTLLDIVTVTDAGPVRGAAVRTVDGMAGVGKTAFSVHAAHHLADRFPDGQIFLELYGHSLSQAPRDPADALASLLMATGMERSTLPMEVDDRARLWRDRIAGKKILLVLDDAASHDQLRPLLPGTSECFVLITSRHRLPALEGADALPLGVLPPDQAAQLLLTLAARIPTSLETDSAAAETGAVARIVQSCGYLPLAIALAAGRLRSHPTWSMAYLADLLGQDSDRMEHLAVGDRSIRAAFTVSYLHLAPERQWVFILLGVHPGPSIDAYALAALADCSLTHARQHLEVLHADHLVQETAPGRYQLHDLVRAYASSLAATADRTNTEHAIRRVLNYYLHTAATADTHMSAWTTPTLTIALQAPAHQPDVDTPQLARAWLDTELATLELPTLATCLDHASIQPDLIIALSTTLHNYLRVSGAFELALRIHHAALAAAEHTHNRPGQATTLTHLGRVYYLRGDWEQAQQLYTQAHQLFTDLGDQRGQASTLSELGHVLLLPGDYERAQQLYTQAHQLFTHLGDQRGHANILASLGRVYYLRGDYERAQEVLDHALQLATDLGYRRGQANIFHILSRLYYLRRDWDRAQQAIDHSNHLWVDLGSRLGQALALLDLGRVRHQKSDYDQALDLLTQAQALFAAIGDRDGQADTLNSLGDLALDHPPTGDPHALFTQAHTLARTVGTALHEAHALAGLGRCAHDAPTATTAFTQALTIYQRLGSPEVATITGYLADLRDNPDQHIEPK